MKRAFKYIILAIGIICFQIISTIILKAQTDLDANGYPRSLHKSHVNQTSTSATSFILSDSLFLPIDEDEGPGQLSKNGLEYYLGMSVLPEKKLLYVFDRFQIGQQFNSPEALSNVVNDTSFTNIQPSISADGKTLVFVRNTIDNWNGDKLYIATRPDNESDFDSVRAIVELNDPDSANAYPWISPDALSLVYTRGHALYATSRPSTSSPFTSPHPLWPSSKPQYLSGWETNDGLTLYVTEKNGSGIAIASRPTTTDTFSTPVHMPDFDGYGPVGGPSTIDDEFYLHAYIILVFSRVYTNVSNNETSIFLPTDFTLEAYPNPFNPSTTIKYSIPKQGHVTLQIFNVLGSEIETLVNADERPGTKSVIFDASGLASGVYFYRLQYGSYHKTNKLFLLR
jgi:hypothetical protein